MTMLCSISILVSCGGDEGGTARLDGFCGDGQVNQPGEVCDDGNTNDGDACSADCSEELCTVASFDARDKLVGCAGDPMLGGCHAGANRPTSMVLDLTAPSTTLEDALLPLVDQIGSSGGFLIDSNDVSASFLLQKLTSDPGFGSRMPLSPDEYWSAEEVDCLRLDVEDVLGL